MLEKRVRTGIVSLLLGGLLLAGATRSGTADEESQAQQEALRRRVEALRNQEAEEARLRAEWTSRAVERRRAVARAREKLAEIESSRVMAQDGAYQGIKRSEWTRRQKQAEQDVRDAEHALDDLYEDARQADIPPGWLDDDDPDDAASPED